eukprot:CAMPEP_0194033998 /NCGR_PEP_ID=MMETSP0009_2-20130614/6438_1 /TAXON_ID=210454 /ORGANISM="Grammatophora oceanica, Strain CCMP 410" /LENGTH=322 /DNA_ID=CAMNT_0038674733 /DNA_START=60 /DNA_END=1025 /DNA_ORIENTATION=+
MAAAPPPQSYPYDHLFKILIIGDAGVGKSSMLLRFTDDSFDEHIQSTIGVDFKVKHLDVGDGKRVKLTIWDTAGQERFRTLTSSYYRGAHGVVLVYDVTRTDTFENLQQWLKEVQLYSPNNGESVVKLLVGNKIDLGRKVDRELSEEWARDEGMLFLEASAKTKLGIRQVFMEVVQKILDDPELLESTKPGQKPKVQLRPHQTQRPNASNMMADEVDVVRTNERTNERRREIGWMDGWEDKGDDVDEEESRENDLEQQIKYETTHGRHTFFAWTTAGACVFAADVGIRHGSEQKEEWSTNWKKARRTKQMSERTNEQEHEPT